MHALAQLGRYQVRGYNTFNKQMPTFDDLTFVPATMTRLPLEGYRESCETRTVLGGGRGLVEKPIERYYVNAGIYILNPETLDMVPDQKFYDMPTLLNSLMDKGEKVGGFPLRDYWVDIGRIEDLERASAEFTEMFG